MRFPNEIPDMLGKKGAPQAKLRNISILLMPEKEKSKYLRKNIFYGIIMKMQDTCRTISTKCSTLQDNAGHCFELQDIAGHAGHCRHYA